jgi:hypothetical protein
VKLNNSGKVQDYAGSGTAVGNALEASTADGDIVRVIFSANVLTVDDAGAAS